MDEYVKKAVIKYKGRLVHPLLEIKRQEVFKRLDDEFRDMAGGQPLTRLILTGFAFGRVKGSAFIPSFVQPKDFDLFLTDVPKKIRRRITNRMNDLFKRASQEINEYQISPDFFLKESRCKVVCKHMGSQVKIMMCTPGQAITKVIPQSVYSFILDRLVMEFPYGDRNMLIWCCIYRYDYLNIRNVFSIGIHPVYAIDVWTKFQPPVNPFGSLWGNTNRWYYGLFPDLEVYFGCIGVINKGIIPDGVHLISVDRMLYKCVERNLLQAVHRAGKSLDNISFIVCIPQMLPIPITLHTVYYQQCNHADLFMDSIVHRRKTVHNCTLMILSSVGIKYTDIMLVRQVQSISCDQRLTVCIHPRRGSSRETGGVLHPGVHKDYCIPLKDKEDYPPTDKRFHMADRDIGGSLGVEKISDVSLSDASFIPSDPGELLARLITGTVHS